MTIAAYPLRARVGLALGAMALRERPRFGGQSDATVREAWFFGSIPDPAEYALASTLPPVSLLAEMSLSAAQLVIGSHGSRRGGRRGS